MIARRPFLAALFGLPGTALLATGQAQAEAPFITVASTPSTEQSGLFGHLLPAVTKATGIEVRVVAVGTGQALKIGERGDADVLLVQRFHRSTPITPLRRSCMSSDGLLGRG